MFRDPGLYAAVQGPSTVRMDMELKRRRSKIRVDRVVYPGRDRAPPMRKGGRPSSWADAFRFVGDRKVSCPEIQSGAITNRNAFCDPGYDGSAVPGSQRFASGPRRNRFRFCALRTNRVYRDPGIAGFSRFFGWSPDVAARS